MIQQDTIRLLRECDAGIKMGVAAIDDVFRYICAESFKQRLADCKAEHVKLQNEIQLLLDEFNDQGKEPNPISKSMSWVKTNVTLAIDESDKAIADLMTDGCNMGVKSLNRFLNQYQAADERSKNITKRLSDLEEKLVVDMRPFL